MSIGVCSAIMIATSAALETCRYPPEPTRLIPGLFSLSSSAGVFQGYFANRIIQEQICQVASIELWVSLFNLK